MSAVDFSKLNKVTAKSFNEQKALIKKVLLGRDIKCSTCNLPLSVVHPKQAGTPGIYCPKGCTSIELDIT